jgi:hypothetical protein
MELVKMGIMNAVKGGADLTKPSLSVGWVVTAFFGIMVLIVVVVGAMFVFGKAKQVIPGASAVTEGARTYMS